MLRLLAPALFVALAVFPAWAEPTSVARARAKWTRAYPPAGRDTLRLRRARADALAQITALSRRGASAERSAALDALLDFGLREPARPLQMFAAAELTRRERSLGERHRARLGELRERIFPRRLPTPGRGLILVRHYVGEEFSDQAMKALTRLKGFPPLRYGEVEAVLFLEKDDSATDRQLDAMAKLVAGRPR
jgi:hypothetical protein